MGKGNGTCLCGSVKFEVSLEDYQVSACQCSMCRRWAGGIFLSLDVKNSLVIRDPSGLKHYKSSEWGQRGFCEHCGTSLFWQTADGKQTYVTYSSLELSESELDKLKLTAEIFVDNQPKFYCFGNKTERLTGEDVMRLLRESGEI